MLYRRCKEEEKQGRHKIKAYSRWFYSFSYLQTLKLCLSTNSVLVFKDSCSQWTCQLAMCLAGVWHHHTFRSARVRREAWTRRLARARVRVYKGCRLQSEHHSERIYSSASLSTNIMEKITLSRGLHAELRPWRPWASKTSRGRKTATHKVRDEIIL